ncbi:uncharacterized protein LOC128984223 [Macrosteles quadrilineatus]|uniref:uncharacterized protein LOC128984223 n=1 Tax=Macrosteles quadrilineatus TaxID=74068 RepID=UPI0023E22391|nr:uncharacterized protein LOC128984223 [Macrosteles quadrilineatus]
MAAYNKIVASDPPSNVNVEPSPAVQPKPKLPQIYISKFGGQLEQFNSFKALYDNLIHNTSLAPMEKFSYLKSLLEGPALSIVEGIPFDPDNYKLAYDSLVERYTNPRILACFYLNKILDQQPVKTPSLSSLRQVLDVFHINVQALKSLKVDDLSDFMLLQLALRNLDNSTRKAFELELKSKQFPTLEDLMEFLRAQCCVYELTKESHKSTLVLPKSQIPHTRKTLFSSHSTHRSTTQSDRTATQSSYRPAISCPMCKGEHQLYRCDQFLALAPHKRYSTVRSFNRCFACLGSHLISMCTSKSSCRVCRSNRHHSLLHEPSRVTAPLSKPNVNPDLPQTSAAHSSPSTTVNPVPTTSVNTTPPAQTLSCQFQHNSMSNSTLLGTAQVLVQDALGHWQVCRAVIDGGSQINFVTQSLAQTLRLPIRKCNVNISGIGQQSDLTAKGLVTCNVASRYNRDDNIQIDAVIIPQISSVLPAAPIPESLINRFNSIQLADPDFHRPAKVDILFGAQAFTDILSDGFALIKGKPSALSTIFGWILMGDVPKQPMQQHELNSLFVSSQSTDRLLEKFWEMEEINLPKPLSPSDQACEDHYQSTIQRDNTGRYVASLPFKDVKPDLGSTLKNSSPQVSPTRDKISQETRYSFSIHDSYAELC